MLIDNTKIIEIINDGWCSQISLKRNLVRKNLTWGTITNRLDCINTEPFPQINDPTSIDPCLLYIDPKCTISRDSLRLNNFKITRDPHKADYIVIPNVTVYTEEGCIYQCGDQILYYESRIPLSDTQIRAIKQKWYLDMKLIHNGTVYGCKYLSTAQLLLNYSDMKFIYDSTLQKFLNADNLIDYDTMVQLDALLNSSENVGLGLKLMASFNVEKNRLPLEILCVIHNDAISRCSEKSQILIKSMLDNLQYNSWDEIREICKKYSACLEKEDPMTPICLQFIKSYFVREMEKNSYRMINSIKSAGLNVKISVE